MKNTLSVYLLIVMAAPSLAEERSVPPSFPGGLLEFSPRLSLTDLQGMAFQHNPTLAAAAARMKAAQGRQFQAGRYPNPVAGYHGTEIGNQDTAGQQGGFVSQRFITAKKLKLDQAAAGQTVREAQFKWLAQEQRVLTDVGTRFYETLAAQRRVEITKKLAEIGDSLVDATQKLLDGRQRTLNDLLQAQIRSDEAEILLDNAQNELDEAWRRLAAVIGIPSLELTTLKGELGTNSTDLDWEKCSALALAGNPELEAAKARARKARVLISRAEREPIPNIDLSVSVRHIFPTDSDVANVQVGIPIPIFDKNRGNIQAAKSEWVAACKEIKRIELQLQERLAVSFRRYANAVQQKEKYENKILPRAERSLALVTKGYQNGQVEYLTLLVAQQTYLQASLSHLTALSELRAAETLLQGRLLSGSLNSGR